MHVRVGAGVVLRWAGTLASPVVGEPYDGSSSRRGGGCVDVGWGRLRRPLLVNRVELMHNQEIMAGIGDITPICFSCYARDHTAIQPQQVRQVRQVLQMIQISLEIN